MDKNNQIVSRLVLLKFLILIVILISGVFLGQYFHLDIDLWQEKMLVYPLIFSGPLFIALYVVSTLLILFGPKDILRIASALVFGAKISTILVTIAEIINATVLFFMARILGREYVAKRFKFYASHSAYEAPKETSFLSLMALRANPLVPFRIMDIGFGLTNVPFFKYFLVIVLLTPLRVYWLQMIIAGVGNEIFKNPKFVINYLTSQPQMLRFSAIYFLLVAVLSLLALIFRVIRRKRELERDA